MDAGGYRCQQGHCAPEVAGNPVFKERRSSRPPRTLNECIGLISPTERANIETTCHAPNIWKRGLVKAVDRRLNANLQLFGCVVQAQEGTTSRETCAVSPWTKLDRTITGPHDTNGVSFSSRSITYHPSHNRARHASCSCRLQCRQPGPGELLHLGRFENVSRRRRERRRCRR